MNTIDNLDFPYPSSVEAEQIANYLDDQTSKIDALIQKAESAISLIQERRTALISAAVTGKIDVRNWQAPVTSEVTE
jgi:type I restriction enzyme S subunit